jgi:hypothetical protein
MRSSKKIKPLLNKQAKSFQYAKLRQTQIEELSKEYLRLVAAFYGHIIEAGDKTLKDYDKFTMADLSQEIRLRTILLQRERMRRETKKEEEKQKAMDNQSKILEQLKKETSGR